MKTEENENKDDDYFKVKMKNNTNSTINNINNVMINNNKNNKIYYQDNTFRYSKQSDSKLNKHTNNLSLNTKNNTNDEKVILSNNNDEHLNNDKKSNIKAVNSMRTSKPLKIIEQIKKEKKESNNEINQDENNLKKNNDNNINQYTTLRTQNNKKNKSKQIFNQLLSSSPKKKLSTTENKNIIKTLPNIKSPKKTKKKSSPTLTQKFIQKNNNKTNNNDNNNDNDKNNENEDERIYKLLKEKYLDYLKRTFDGNIPKITKEEEKLNENLLRHLAKKELPIENENLDNIKCSNDMKAFLMESLNNFKLLQMKDKFNGNNINEINNNHQKFDPAKSHLIGLIHLDYENDIKDSHMFEPIELEKSYMNKSIKKSIIDSFNGNNHH